MPDPILAYTVAVFVLAGFVKGVIGLGLPTVAMGLMVLVATPAEAAAILVVPSFITNLWQLLAGGNLWPCLQRLWPMMAAICAGTWLGPALPATSAGGYAAAALGAGLVAYALAGLSSFRLAVRPDREVWLSPAVGLATGAISAGTGVFVIPAVPYLQGLGLDKDDLIRALGLSFTVSTLALAGNLARSGALAVSMAGPALAALAAAGAGMAAGQMVRDRLSPNAFRSWFFAGLMALGAYLAARAAV